MRSQCIERSVTRRKEEKKSYVYSGPRQRQKGKTWITVLTSGNSQYCYLHPTEAGLEHLSFCRNTADNRKKYSGHLRQGKNTLKPVSGPQFIIAVKIQVCDLKYNILL